MTTYVRKTTLKEKFDVLEAMNIWIFSSLYHTYKIKNEINA